MDSDIENDEEINHSTVDVIVEVFYYYIIIILSLFTFFIKTHQLFIQ